MIPCYKKRKHECLLSPQCKWIVGTGCRNLDWDGPKRRKQPSPPRRQPSPVVEEMKNYSPPNIQRKKSSPLIPQWLLYEEDEKKKIVSKVPLKTTSKVKCVNYVDEYSINETSINDLEVGHQYRTVGNNSKNLGSAKMNDIVMITATDGGIRYVVIGVIKNKLESCDLWERNGGHLWKYNFTYVPITDIFKVTTDIREKIVELCNIDPNKPHPNKFFNPRFCGDRYKNIILELANYVNNRYR